MFNDNNSYNQTDDNQTSKALLVIRPVYWAETRMPNQEYEVLLSNGLKPTL